MRMLIKLSEHLTKRCCGGDAPKRSRSTKNCFGKNVYKFDSNTLTNFVFLGPDDDDANQNKKLSSQTQ